jgi:CheY-like chemotaxis protein
MYLPSFYIVGRGRRLKRPFAGAPAGSNAYMRGRGTPFTRKRAYCVNEAPFDTLWAARIPPGTRHSMPQERILVVDDSPTILKLVQLVLTKADYRVTTASEGPSALAIALEEPPDLALVDYLMPGMDGQAVCAALAADSALAHVPVVLMSARGEEVETRARQLSNVVDAIAKPFTPDALLTVIGHSLAGRAAIEEVVVDLGSLSLAPQNPAAKDELGILATAALGGDISVISIADVYSLLQDEAQTGVLSIIRSDARLQVCLKQGRIDFATAEGVPEEFLLGRFLVKAGAIAKADLALALEQRGPRGSQQGLLGADLVGRGLITPAGLRNAVSYQTSALVFESLRWGAGRFWFDATAALPEAAEEAALGLAVDSLIMEGYRRVDQWRLIEREIGDFDLVFVRDDGKVAAFGRNKLTREETLVLELVNGRNTVRDIIQLSHLGSFDTTKMLYRLLRTKLIRKRVTPVAT